MKAIDIEKFLKDNYIGKTYDSYHSAIGNAVLDYLEANGFDKSKMCFEKSNAYSSCVYIEVRAPYKAGSNVAFITVETKKKKTATHHCWSGSYCDWAYVDFSVTCGGNDTVEDACKQAVNAIQTRLDNVQAKENKAKEIFEFLKSKGYSEYDASDLVRFASDIRYTLSERVYKSK